MDESNAEGAAEEPQETGAAPTQEERTMAMVCHLAGILASALLPILVPLVIFLTKRDESEFIGDQAKEALNFQITVALAMIVAGALTLCVVGFFLLPVLFLANLVLSIVAGIKAYEGERYRYPVALRLIT